MIAGTEVTDFAELRHGSHRFLLRQGSATHLDLPDDSVDAIVTDPPYFDSVQYSDLSAFFRVWLRQMLPQAGNWDFDLQDSAVDPHNNDRESRYAELLGQIFCRMLSRASQRGRPSHLHLSPLEPQSVGSVDKRL